MASSARAHPAVASAGRALELKGYDELSDESHRCCDGKVHHHDHEGGSDDDDDQEEHEEKDAQDEEQHA